MSLLVDIEKQLGSFHLSAHFETEDAAFGLLGASGCGKSCTLQCIAGVAVPDAGRIVLDGETLFDAERRINLPPQRRRVGYLFQHYALFPTMTVRQNILCGLRWQKDRRAREAALQEAVRRFRLTGLEDHRPSQLSGGQAQRVALARMIVNRPRLLMLDEPFSALDSYLRTSLQVELSEMLSGVDQRVLLVTHDRDEAYRLCPRIAIMEQGRIAVQGTREAVFANPGTAAAAAITGCKNIAPARPVSARSLRCDDWDVTLTLASDVPPDTRFVGLRAHAMTAALGPGENVLPLRDPEISETPFSVSVLFRAGQGRVRWEIDRTAWQPYAEAGLPRYLQIDPRGVMALR